MTAATPWGALPDVCTLCLMGTDPGWGLSPVSPQPVHCRGVAGVSIEHVVTDSDLFTQVVVNGDPYAPDGTVGRLMNVFDDCVVIETLPDAANHDGCEWLVGIESVSRADGKAAAA